MQLTIRIIKKRKDDYNGTRAYLVSPRPKGGHEGFVNVCIDKMQITMIREDFARCRYTGIILTYDVDTLIFNVDVENMGPTAPPIEKVCQKED